MPQKISIVAAMTKNRAIGKDNSLIVTDKKDMKVFKSLTENHIVIMGRKTFESLPNQKPLANRMNIVLTKDASYQPPSGVVLASSINEALHIAKFYFDKNVFIIGGGEIYKQAISIADEIILTTFGNLVYEEADTFFPQFGTEFSLNTTCYIKPDMTVKYYINNDRKTI